KLRWRAWTRSSFPELEIKSMPAFPGQARRIGLGDVHLWHIRSLMRVEARRRTSSDATSNAFVALQMTGGTRVFAQGTAWNVEPGQLSIGRPSAEFQLTIEKASDYLLLEAPWSLLVTQHPQLERIQARLFAVDEPGAVLLREVMLK